MISDEQITAFASKVAGCAIDPLNNDADALRLMFDGHRAFGTDRCSETLKGWMASVSRMQGVANDPQRAIRRAIAFSIYEAGMVDTIKTC